MKHYMMEKTQNDTFSDKNDDEIIFDRNDGQSHNQESLESQQLKDLRRVINESTMLEFPPNVVSARKRVVNKLLDIVSIQNDINSLNPESIVSNTDVIDSDMFVVGTINNKILNIDIPPITIKIDLSKTIRNAILYKNPKAIYAMLENNIDLFKIEPKIMIMCVENNQDELLMELIARKIPIHTDQFRCLYQLAANGKLDFVKIIMQNYNFPFVPEIVSKICIQAIQNNHVHILRYFISSDVFKSSPDQMFCFFINSIQYGGHLDVIRFFVDMGIDIRQENYKAVQHAIQFDRIDIIKYFCDFNEQKCKY